MHVHATCGIEKTNYKPEVWAHQYVFVGAGDWCGQEIITLCFSWTEYNLGTILKNVWHHYPIE